jgi:hypothetical protein
MSPDDRTLLISFLPSLQLLAERNPPDIASYLSHIESIRGSFASSEQQDGNLTAFVALLTTVSANGIREMTSMAHSRPTTVVVQHHYGHEALGISTLTAASDTNALTAVASTTASTATTATTAPSTTAP